MRIIILLSTKKQNMEVCLKSKNMKNQLTLLYVLQVPSELILQLNKKNGQNKEWVTQGLKIS